MSGRIVDAYAGALPQPDAVLMTRIDGPGPSQTRTLPIRSDRTFAAEDVPPGEYLLQATYSLFTTSVTVGTSKVAGIELVVSGQVRLTLRVRMDDGTDVPSGVMYRMLFEQGRTFFAPLGGRAGLSLPPGSRWFFILPPASYYLASATFAGVDLRRNPIALTPANAGGVMDVVITRTKPVDAPMVRIAGIVTAQVGVDVELVNTTSPTSRSVIGTTTTGADGRFQFDGLAPGVYQINVPPAERVREVAVGAGTVEVEIPVPAGARIVGATVVTIYDGARRFIPIRPAHLNLVAERDGVQTRIPVEFMGYWGALPPGAYRLTVEGLQAGYTVRALAAGSVNLLEAPFVVPVDRPAERISLELNYNRLVN